MRLILLFFICNNWFASYLMAQTTQEKTVYFDKDYNIVNRKSGAMYYLELKWENGKIVNPSRDYYMSGVLHWLGNVITCENNNYVTDGKCIWYDEEGKKQYQVNISGNAYNGKYIAWYPSGHIKEVGYYLDGLMDGCDKMYDESGYCTSAKIVVNGKSDYASLPDNPRYKVTCNCEEKNLIAGNNVSNKRILLQPTIYGSGFVKDHISDKLSSKESVLLRLMDENSKNSFIYFDFNAHEENDEKQVIANSIYYGLINSKQFVRTPIENYNNFLNSPILFTVSYSNIYISVADVDRSATANGGPTATFEATVSCFISIRNYKGDFLLRNQSFTGVTNTHIAGASLGFSYTTREEAITNSASNLQKKITKYFKKEFNFDIDNSISFYSNNSTTETQPAQVSQNTNTVGAARVSEKGIFKFENELHDFGDVSEGPAAEWDFNFVNEGNSSIVISDAHGSCGCITLNWSHDQINPGGSGNIHVSYNTKGRIGRIDKLVTINSNAQQQPMTIYIKGMVKPN